MAQCPQPSRARGEPRPPDGRRLVRPGEARGRARDVGPVREREDPRLPQGEDPEAGARLPPRQGADLRRGRRQPHRRLVLERRVAESRAPGLRPAVRVRASGHRGRGVELRRDRRRPAAPGARRLDDARGRACRGRGAGGGRRRGDRGAARVGRRARAGGRAPGEGGRHARRRPRRLRRRGAARHGRRARRRAALRRARGGARRCVGG